MRWPKKKQQQRWLILLASLAIIVVLFDRCQDYKEHSQDENILAAARKYGMDPALVKAVVWRESRFNPHVRGKVGEIGLMQVGEAAAKEWARSEGLSYFEHTELFDPAKNTMAGTWYLRKALRRYGNTDLPAAFALAEYNAGRNNVLRWVKEGALTNSAAFFKQMDFPRTRDYVKAILKRQPRYQKQFEAKEKKAQSASN